MGFLGGMLLTPLASLAEKSVADRVLPDRVYYVYVCAESEDEVALVRYGPSGLEVAKTISVGSFPAKIEGPHGITVSPDGAFWYVSLAHGMPFGSVHKYRTGSDEWLGEVTLGMFPATMAISPTTGLLYVVNFDLHGDLEPSTLSIVEPESMTEVARVETGVRPHGSRLSPQGDRHYSVSMHDDELIEVDALRFEVIRRLDLSNAGGVRLGPADSDAERSEPVVAPTWVTVPTVAGKVYVAGSKSDSILEIDIERWQVVRIFGDAGSGPYNLEVVEPLNLLIATYKSDASIGFWDLESGLEVAREDTLRGLPHGVVATPDGAFSFVSVEGVGGEPGMVEVYDNRSRQRVGSVGLGKQAGGLAYWAGPSD